MHPNNATRPKTLMRRLLVARLERHLTRTTAPRLQMLVLVFGNQRSRTTHVGLPAASAREPDGSPLPNLSRRRLRSVPELGLDVDNPSAKALGPDSEDCGHLANEARRGSSLRRSAAGNAEFPEPVGRNPVRFGRVCGYYARRRWGSLDLLCDLGRGFRYRARPRSFGRNFSRWRLLRGVVSAAEPN